MVIKRFPPIESASEDGLLAIGGDLEPESLLLAYKEGIFPWPLDMRTLAWFSPPQRAVLFLDNLHISRSLKKLIARSIFELRINTCFREVITNCSESVNRKGQMGTWIIPQMIDAYVKLHELGYAHSIEVFRDDSLAGGLYGVSIGKFFAGESMFYKESNCSKLALMGLVEVLRQNRVSWLDCQVMTPLLRSFGTSLITRESFMKLLSEAIPKRNMNFKNFTLIPGLNVARSCNIKTRRG